MKRLYYLTDSINCAQNISDKLHQKGITDWNFHIMSKNKDDLDKQTLDLELIRLQSLLDRYVQEESYEKAKIIKRKIEIIKKNGKYLTTNNFTIVLMKN